MQERALQCESTTARRSRRPARTKAAIRADESVILVKEMPYLINQWLLDGEGSGHSKGTINLRKILTTQLVWFLESIDATECSLSEMRQFMAYLNASHPTGRWGKDSPAARTALRPATISSYYTHIRSFFNWLVNEEIISESPMQNVKRPINRADQIQPFSLEQLKNLLEAARQSSYGLRDEAILRFLLDTGVRVSEMCTLTLENVDFSDRSAYVLGKGNKRRTVHFGPKTAKALLKYLREDDRTPSDPVFLSERGRTADAEFTPSGLFQLIERLGKRGQVEGTAKRLSKFQLIERLGKRANIRNVRCSPHTLRHTFAVMYIREGGTPFALRTLLGHSTLQMTMRYVALCGADIKANHREHSPGELF